MLSWRHSPFRFANSICCGRALWQPNRFKFVLPWPVRIVQPRASNHVLAPGFTSFRRTHNGACHTESTSTTASSERLYELSLDLSQSPANGNVDLDFTVFDDKGASTRHKETKIHVANDYKMTTRDLRTFDLPSDGFPHLLVRQRTILVHLFDLRLLIQSNRVLFLHVNGSEHNLASRVFVHDLHNKLLKSQMLDDTASEAFELKVLEAALGAATSTLEAEYKLVKQDSKDALERLDSRMSDEEEAFELSVLRGLLDLVRKLASIEQRGRLVRGAMQEILNEDEDMADMYLSDKQRGQLHLKNEHQHVEYLLEAYFKANDAIVQEATSAMNNIKRTEETIRSLLSVRRNRIMVLETKIEIAVLGPTSATLVAGWYGMNVINYLEDDKWAFAILVSLSWLGIGLIWRYGLRQLRLIRRGSHLR